MQIKWSNVLFGIVLCILLIAIFQQLYIFKNNITTSITQNDSEVESKDIIDKPIEEGPEKAKKNIIKEDFLKLVIKKTIPMMELGYKKMNEESNSFFLSLFSMTTKIDMKDPKTLLSAQIPILEKYEHDDVEISQEDQKAFQEQVQKPMNDNKVENSNITASRGKLDNKEPLVLIYHTHTTESYTTSSKTKINYCSPWRTTDMSKSVAKVGAEIKNILEQKYGIKVIHDTTLHDYPQYNGSYTRSLKTVEKILKNNPSIKYVFDIHRDGLPEGKKNREKYVSVFSGQKAAKVMMVVGNDNFNAKENLDFAKKINEGLNSKASNLTHPLKARDNRKYNQFVSDYAALIEVGSNLNTLEEAIESSKPIGEVIGETIVKEEKK